MPGLLPQDGFWTSLKTASLQKTLWQVCSPDGTRTERFQVSGQCWWGWLSCCGCQREATRPKCVQAGAAGEETDCDQPQGLAAGWTPQALPAGMRLSATPPGPTKQTPREPSRALSLPTSLVPFTGQTSSEPKGKRLYGMWHHYLTKGIKGGFGAQRKKFLIGAQGYNPQPQDFYIKDF